jgi:hypothetical protein
MFDQITYDPGAPVVNLFWCHIKYFPIFLLRIKIRYISKAVAIIITHVQYLKSLF